MQKTPVSILQEMMVKKGNVPNYELIHDGGGSHENTFTYRVAVDGLCATGTGRCKKDAKHAAAKNMLVAIASTNKLLPLPASPADSPVRTPLPKPMPTPHVLPPNEPFVNAIGELQDLCAENELGEVVYETISDIGPPHARIFTIQCIVSSFRESGEATTKKQAKHEAARKMYNRIKDIVDNPVNRAGVCVPADASEAMSNGGILEKYSKLNSRRKAILGVKVADYHIKLSTTFDHELRYSIIAQLDAWKTAILDPKNTWTDTSADEYVEKLSNLVEPLSADAQKLLQPFVENSFVMTIGLSTIPEIVDMGVDKDVGALGKRVFLSVIDTLRELLV